jgi:hypothetical protein
MARAANSTGFEDQVDFKSLTGLLHKYNRQHIAKEPRNDPIWGRKVDFSPRHHRHSSPPRLKNFVCNYRALTPAMDARIKAQERAVLGFLPTSVSRRQESIQTCSSLPKPQFATVFRIARPFDVKLRVAKGSSDHRSPYKDPEMFEYRELNDPKYYFRPQWSCRMTPDPFCLRSKTKVLPERQVYSMKEHCFRDVDPGQCFNTRKSPLPRFDPRLFFKKNPYPDTAYDSFLGRIEGSLTVPKVTSNSMTNYKN